jgi:uncharacterized protein YabN with tetrapyrrole methylase and pyrophosphatase domain
MAGQVTAEALALIERSEKLLYLVTDPLTRAWLESLNPAAESLFDSWREGRPRMEACREMVEKILDPVRRGFEVCAAFYGHPGVCAFPAHEAVRQARGEGYEARMLPGISSADCLFADLGIDPAERGCQMYEASVFLYRQRRFDPAAALILWQVSAIGLARSLAAPPVAAGLRLLAEVLAESYPADHEILLYEASLLPICAPKVARVALAELPKAKVGSGTVLYVPPREEVEYDWATVERARRLDRRSARAVRRPASPRRAPGRRVQAAVVRFLHALALDPRKTEDFRAHPERVPEAAALAKEDRALLDRGDIDAILARFGHRQAGATDAGA